MKLRINKTKRRPFMSLLGSICIGLGALTTEAIKYDDQGTTNYLGVAINDFRLKIGVTEPDNTLFVTNGGIASVTKVYVGEFSPSTNNFLSVANGGLIFAGNVDTNTVSTGGIFVGDTAGKGMLSINNSSTVDTDYLYIGRGTNESGTVSIEGEGRLIVREQLFVGSDVNSNNVMDVKSGASIFINEASDLVIGNIAGASNGFNTVNIESTGKLLVGGDVNATSFTSSNLNFEAGSILGAGGALTIDNSAIEDGLNILLDDNLSTNTSQWSTSEMYVGDATGNNSLTLTNGATATASDLVYIGNKASSSDNTITVTGSNSLFTAQDKILVGAAGDRNTFEITEGGKVIVAKDLNIGSSNGSDNNSVTISGVNSILMANENVIIGVAGRNNSLTLTDATMTVAQSLELGAGSANNRYTQTGGTNTVSGEFIIGKTTASSGQTGAVDNNTVETTGNLALIGKDARLNIQQNLTVGLGGSGSILAIRDGGIVNVTGDAIIGEAVGDNYIYLQRDSNTRFNVAGDLVVGKEGGSNRFAVYGGTANIAGNLYLGASTNQHEIQNFIHVETSNAVIHVANAIYIGASNSVNTLDLVAGATVTAQDLFVGAYEGVSNNAVTVTGENSLLSITNNLTLGSDTGTNNTLTIENGGTLFVGGTISEVGGSNNVLNVNNDGTLQTLDWDFASISSNLFLNSGSTLKVGGILTGTNQVEGGIGFTLDGSIAQWDTTTNTLYVGYETDNNTLTITNGALVSTATNLYIGFSSANNTVSVGGTGSVLNVGYDLLIGNMDNTASGVNSLFVLDGGLVTVGNNLKNVQGGVLEIDSKSQVTVTGDYEQDRFSGLSVGISSNTTPPNLVVAGNAELAKGSTISVYDNGIGDNTNVVQNIVQAGTLTIDGATASTGLLFENITIQSNLLLNFTVTISNGTMNSFIVLDNFITRSIAEAAGLDGMLGDVADEIQGLAVGGDERAVELVKTITGLTEGEANQVMNDYYGEKGSSAPMHNVVNQGIGSIASELTGRGDNTRSRMASSSSAPTPIGAEGPHAQDQGLQGWIAGYGTWGDKSSADGFDAYDSSLGGFIIGADLAVSQNILVGLAGGSNSGSVDKNNGASGNTKTTYGAIYASLGTKDWFLDGSMIYGSSSIDNTLGDVLDTTASYDAQNLAFYLGGGKEIIGKYLIITPQASMLVNYYKQDAYEEQASGALPRSVDSFDALYVQSSLGCSLAAYTTVGKITLKPEVRAHWLHEFNAKEEDLAYTLIGGTGNYNMILQAPEEDVLRLGAGVSAKLSESLELRADFDTQLASAYSDHTVSGSIRYQF